MVVDLSGETAKTFTVHRSLYPNLNDINFALFALYKQTRHNDGTIIWKGLPSHPNRHAHYELFMEAKKHHVRLFYNSESAEQFPLCEEAKVLADDKNWHTVLSVFERGSRSLKVYLDGKDITASCRDESQVTTPLVDDPTVS